MSTTKQIQIKTDNKKFGKIEVDITVAVPENLQEAEEFYGSADKLLDSIQGDVARRRANAARPALRDSEVQLDWTKVAQEVADSYTPGRRGGFAGVAVSEDELRSAGSMDELLAILKARGVNLVGAGAEENGENDEESSDA